jgi:hypothetical protein
MEVSIVMAGYPKNGRLIVENPENGSFRGTPTFGNLHIQGWVKLPLILPYDWGNQQPLPNYFN